MPKGFDTSTPLTLLKAQQFKEARYDFVCRYLAPKSWNAWKALTAEEADNISQAGLEIVSAWETTAGAAREGATAGKDAGIFSLQAAQEVGQTQGSKIYGCVDFEARPSEFPIIGEYFKAFKAQLVGYELDGYGNDAILNYLKANGIIRNGWQTIAWSYGRKSTSISIYQSDCGPNGTGFPMFGIPIDADESYGNEGWWNTMGVQPMDRTKAEIMEAILGECFELGITSVKGSDGTIYTLDRPLIHDCANEVRRVSNQPQT